MDKVLVYKDKDGLIRHVELNTCPVEVVQTFRSRIKSFLVSGGAPAPASPVFALIRCK